ncbi:MAG: DUF4349 domain-containing protein [Opitutaceae bacterium]|nr:DUF4349 domain-containing protein [Cytophagales bacterium]
MKSLNVYLSILFILFLSCSSEKKESIEMDVASASMENRLVASKMSAPENEAKPDKKEKSQSENVDPKIPNNKKKIIKDGNISVKTKDIITGKKNIDEVLKQLNAYYETEDLQNDDQRISYNLRVRVPAENFEKLIATLENGKEEVQSKSIQARDVTEEFVDIESRLKSKREYLNKYMSLLTRATTIKDILAIEENIRIIQEEIESREGRLKYLTDQVSFSTLSINLFSEKEYVYKPEQEDNFSERVKKALSNGWNSIVELLLVIFSIWPFVVIIIAGLVIFRKWKKRNRNL